jgi:excisionase family DNA binding protein
VLGKPSDLGSPLASGVTDAAGLPELLSPADAAKALGVPESDVMKVIESGELPSKKIGDSHRITRQALQQYIGT